MDHRPRTAEMRTAWSESRRKEEALVSEGQGLQIARFDPERLQREVIMLGKHESLADYAINEQACCAGFIEWNVETEVPCPFPHNEIHFALSGRAEYTYTFHPDHMEERTQVLEAGDLCLIRYGMSIRVRPLEDPYRVVFVVMPMPEIPYSPVT